MFVMYPKLVSRSSQNYYVIDAVVTVVISYLTSTEIFEKRHLYYLLQNSVQESLLYQPPI